MTRPLLFSLAGLAAVCAFAFYDMTGKTCTDSLAISAAGRVSVYETCRTRYGLPITPRFIRVATYADYYNLDWSN